MADLIHCIEYTENVEYKIVLAVHDLDRIKPEKVMLEQFSC